MNPGPSGTSRKGLLNIPTPSLLKKPTRPPHRRRLSAKGEELRTLGDAMGLGFYHVNRVYDLAKRFGLYSNDKLDKMMYGITDPAKSGDERVAEYAKAATVIDNHLEIQGQPRVCGSAKTIAEVRVILQRTSEPIKRPSNDLNIAGPSSLVPSLKSAPPAPTCPSCQVSHVCNLPRSLVGRQMK